MAVIGIVGGYNRECLQSLLNPLFERGGLTEVRMLKLGDEELIESVLNELKLLFEFENIHCVDVKGLVCKDGVCSEASKGVLLT